MVIVEKQGCLAIIVVLNAINKYPQTLATRNPQKKSELGGQDDVPQKDEIFIENTYQQYHPTH